MARSKVNIGRSVHVLVPEYVIPHKNQLARLNKLIRIEIPAHIKGGLYSEHALYLLCVARERNLQNKNFIDHITLKEVRNGDGSVTLAPLVIAKPLPPGAHGRLVWASGSEIRRHRFFS
jgi:hypothetical protein